MNILRLVFELFVIYILYKFIFEFIIPVYKTTGHVKQKMNDMQQQMQQNQHSQASDTFTKPSSSDATKRPVTDDYIDYEEIK